MFITGEMHIKHLSIARIDTASWTLYTCSRQSLCGTRRGRLYSKPESDSWSSDYTRRAVNVRNVRTNQYLSTTLLISALEDRKTRANELGLFQTCHPTRDTVFDVD